MDAVEYVKQRRRMCDHYSDCSECPAVEYEDCSCLSGIFKLAPICPAQISSECRDKETGGCYDPGMDCGKCKRDFWLKEIE